MAKHLATPAHSILQADAERHAEKCPLPNCRYGYESFGERHVAPKTLEDIVFEINPSKEN